MLRFFAFIACLFAFLHQKTAACGYNFLGDCSTSISLKINGTLDSFAVAPCPDVLKFDGFALGSLQSLSIACTKAATWESCQNNVSGVALWYRVYEQGFPGGSWQNIDLQEDYNTLVGPYTTRYRSASADASLTDGLLVGKTYVLEIFFRAEIDTIGDDFIPETFLLQNNGGQNYHFTFQYGGPSAPPFVVATTKIVNPKCHGDSTGVAGVTVYGDLEGLFYEWSSGGNNFPILSQIPAGTYSVTVTGAGGYSASDTIEILQPMALTIGIQTQAMILTNCYPADSALVLLVATTNAEAPVFEWVLDGELISTDDSCSFVVKNLSTKTPDLTMTDKHGCSVFNEGQYIAITQPLPLQIETLVTNPSAGFADGSISLDVSGGSPPYLVIWNNNLTSLSISNLPEGTYCATVTDTNGCTETICETLISSGIFNPIVENQLKIAPNPTLPGQWVEVILPENFAGQAILLEILGMQGQALTRQMMHPDQKTLHWQLPKAMPPGIAIIKVTTESGGSAIGKLAALR
jgi:hypothetical protein